MIQNKVNNGLHNKSMAFSIAFLLMTSMFAIFVAVPTADAHTPAWQIPSFAMMVAAPNPVGVGQTVFVSMWVDVSLPGSQISNDIRKHDYTLTITEPDGKILTAHWDVVDDTTGIQFYRFTPDQAGKYTLKFDYGGQTYTWNEANTPDINNVAMFGVGYGGGYEKASDYENDTYLPDSRTITLTVQEEPLPDPITSYPLPTEYWTRPIEAQNTVWGAISSNWLSGPYIEERTQPYGTAPNSLHIMWTKSLDTGGVVGGNYGDIEGIGFYMGGSYNTRFANKIIMNGKLYYELPKGNGGGGGGWMCVDLRTGEELWYNDQMGVSGTGLKSPSFGYYTDIEYMNQHGVIPQGFLITRDWSQMYSANTGQLMYNVIDVPSGADLVDDYGAVLRLVWNSDGRWLAEWNSSRMWTYEFMTLGAGTTPAYGVTLNGTYNEYSKQSTYDWNVTIPELGPGTWNIVNLGVGPTVPAAVSLDNIMLLYQGSLGKRGNFAGANVTAVSLKPGSRGTVLWTQHYPAAPENVSRNFQTWDTEAGVFITNDVQTMAYDGWSLTDGHHLWGPVAELSDYDYFNHQAGGGGAITAYGKLYGAGYGGALYCWDIKTGETLWTYGNGGAGNSTLDTNQPWGNRPIFISTIADGKIYLMSTEHSPNTPLYKDALVRCVNATDGTEIWTMMGWGTGMAATDASIVADGYLVYLNCYDMQLYCVGKGPSDTEVTIQNDVTTHGKKVLVQGSVVDIAAGTEQNEQAARFPHGVPAVSDESMGDWMEYVYMQKPRPTNVTGVEVIVSVLDPNGNCYEVGRTTSDAKGMFKCVFTPEVPGEYTVVATFSGSESYWGSSAETALYVEEALAATPEPTPVPQAPVETYFTVSTIATIIAIAIAVVLLLRKR